MWRGRLNAAQLRGLYQNAQLPQAANFARSRAYNPANDTELQLRRGPITGLPANAIQAPDLDVSPPLPPEKLPPATPIRDELRYGRAQLLPISQGIASVRVLQAPQTNTRRVFLLVVNTHPTQILYLNTGDVASAIQGIPINPGNGALGFDIFVPQDDIYLAANGAATTGVLVYSNKGVNDYPTIAV